MWEYEQKKKTDYTYPYCMYYWDICICRKFLASGDKNILVLASDKDEQPGGGVDMAYMVKLENGTIANYTPVYPGGMTHPTKQALGGLEGPMRLHDCLWDGPEQGMEYAKEIVEANAC